MKYFFLCMLGAMVIACNVSDKKETGSTGVPEKASSFENAGQEALNDSTRSTTMEWIDPVVQNLGNIQKGQVAEISWRFKNTGSKPLFVANVHAQCGCTTPDPPKEPIAPGAEGVIKAKFNSENFSGHVTKEVYVEANNSNRNNGADNKLTFTADIK